jgi:hypothetical protein
MLMRDRPKRILRQFWIVLLAIDGATPLGAQTPAPITDAAATITPAMLETQMAMLATDSLADRETPTAALERAARYVAAQFKAMSLLAAISQTRDTNWLPQEPATSWIQRYPVPARAVRLDTTSSELVLLHALQRNGREVLTNYGRSAIRRAAVPLAGMRFVVPRIPEGGSASSRGAVLLTGRPTAAFLHEADLTQKAVLYLPPADLDSAGQHAVLEQLYEISHGAVLLAPEPPEHFVAEPVAARHRPLRLLDRYLTDRDSNEPHRWAAAVPMTVLQEFLGVLEVDVAAGRAAQAPALRALPGLQVWLRAVFDSTDFRVRTVPNVVGMLEGRGDERGEPRCVLLTAPLDERGRPDSGTDGEAERKSRAVNLAGLLVLAHAFGTLGPEARPRHAVAFLAPSGWTPGEDSWGSQYYARYSHWQRRCRPFVTFTIDFGVGELIPGDTAVIGSMDDLELTMPPAWVAAAHPELRLTVIDGGPVVRSRSDAAVFAREGLPSLLLQAGRLANGPAPGRAVTPDLERMTRLLRLAFYVTYELANAVTPPQWSDAGRRRLFLDRP